MNESVKRGCFRPAWHLAGRKMGWMRLMIALLLIPAIWGCGRAVTTPATGPLIALAYVEAERPELPAPNLFTHLIYAFAEFNDENDGVVIGNPDKLRSLASLKKGSSGPKVILGVGGYKFEGFSEMARDSRKRKRFVDNCARIISDYGLDGVDLDWEFPTTEKGGHSACPEDAVNYGLVVRDLRKKLGKEKWISFYSNCSAAWIDFDAMLPYVDYVNVSGYNLDNPKPSVPLKHQSPLYPSRMWGSWCIDAAVKRHLRKGVPAEKMLLGIPFYGRGKKPFPGYVESYRFAKYNQGLGEKWNDEAKVPYFEDNNGNLVLGFDNERSITEKCSFIRNKGLAGAFVWHYDADYPDHRLARALCGNLTDSISQPDEKRQK